MQCKHYSKSYFPIMVPSSCLQRIMMIEVQRTWKASSCGRWPYMILYLKKLMTSWEYNSNSLYIMNILQRKRNIPLCLLIFSEQFTVPNFFIFNLLLYFLLQPFDEGRVHKVFRTLYNKLHVLNKLSSKAANLWYLECLTKITFMIF